MVLPKLEIIPYQKSADPISVEFDKSLRESEQLEEGNCLAIEEGAKLNKKRRENDEDNYRKKGNDPDYKLFWEESKVEDGVRILEVEENGVCVVIKYYRDSGSVIGDVEPTRRILRSAMNKRKRPSNQIAGVEKNRREHCSRSAPIGRRLKSKSENEKGKIVKASSPDMECDWEYDTFWQNFKIISDCVASKCEGRVVVIEQEMDGENNDDEKEDSYNDGSFSDVEYLGSSSDKEGNTNFSPIELEDEENDDKKFEYNDDYVSDVKTLEGAIGKMNTGGASCGKDVATYREKVIDVLTKPYNQQEYDCLFRDIECHRPEERHLELRNRKEISYLVKKEGKSYLDHYPDFERKLLQVQHDKPKSLNLLRGFFFWLKQPGPFPPWKDAECLAIKPGSS